MSSTKQHELGIAGLALLRNRLVGEEKTTKKVLDEIQKLINISKNSILPDSQIKEYSIDAGYKAWADTYDSIPNLLIKVEEPVVKSLLRKFPPDQTLDAGCGTGRYSNFLHSLGHKVIGVDLSSAMLRFAKTRHRKIKFVKGDLRKLPFGKHSFDLAICALTLTHFSSINQILTELARVVRPGGHIITSDIHPLLVTLGGQAEFYDKTGKHGFIRNYIHWYNTYLQTFNRIGLRVIECLEPIMGQEDLKLAQTLFDLNGETVRTALLGLPIVLIWVLEKS